jgi:hypothetical protein
MLIALLAVLGAEAENTEVRRDPYRKPADREGL